jgi:hypothetical protein
LTPSIVDICCLTNSSSCSTLVAILRENPAYSYEFRELAKIACERSEQISDYIGDNYNIENNWKLRIVYQELLNNEHVKPTKQKPVVLRWVQTMAKASEQVSDVSDVSEALGSGAAQKNDAKTEQEDEKIAAAIPYPPSDTSDTSDSQYDHLLVVRNSPEFGKYYECKEHPEFWDQSIEGILESHFKPFHS